MEKMQYKPVYQTWKMVRPVYSAGDQEKMDHSDLAEGKLRHHFQQQRIGKRLSIAELAEAISCDTETLAAYERGDDLLNADMIKKLKRIFGVP
ncbi:MAG: hypothetical protein CMK59_02850 [Proteobacteria bacterium]|nr:hypothetical protein [Pseudomonadota bacterium]